jgi:hypothetical protein
MKLHKVIQINSVYSVLNGLIALFFAKSISSFMGIIYPIAITTVGIILILFSILLMAILRSEVINIRLVRYVIMLDWLWVVASLIITFFNPFDITAKGLFLIGFTALVVGLMAILQTKAIKAYLKLINPN